MLVRRPRWTSGLIFLFLAFSLTQRTMWAQQPAFKTNAVNTPPAFLNPHPPLPLRHLWDNPLTAEELKSAFGGMSLGTPGANPQQLESLRNFIQKQIEEHPELMDQLKEIAKNPKYAEKLKEYAQSQSGGNSRLGRENLQEFLKANPDVASGITSQAGQPPSAPISKRPRIDQNQSPIPDTAQPSRPSPNDQQPGGDLQKAPLNPPQIASGPKANADDRPQPPGGNPPGLPPALDNQAMPNNPFGKPNEPIDPGEKTRQQLAAMWERSVGPLDETPDIKRALFDMAGGEGGSGLDLKDGQGNSLLDFLKDEQGHGLLDFLKDGSGNSSDLGDLLKGTEGGIESDWKMPKFDFPSLHLGKWFGDSPSSSGPRMSRSGSSSHSLGGRSGSSSGGFGDFGGVGSFGRPLFILLLLVALGIGAWWYFRGSSRSKTETSGNGLGPWPVEPSSIKTRQDIVKAFEYLSILLCGSSARMWTHGTIAAELSTLALSREDAAMKLARLYELARYAPLEEPLSHREIIEARHIVCDLAEATA